MGIYNASLASTSQKPMGIAKAVPTDARSYYYDENLFKWRPYQSTAEALFYLNTPTARTGQFLIIVNVGGTLSGSSFIGGTYKAYWFKDGVEDSNLVPFSSPITVNNVGPDENGNIVIDTGGENGTPYILPIATNSILGGVKVTGTQGISIDPLTGELSSNIPSFLPRSIPFASGTGKLTEDNGGLYYNGVNATFGHNSSTDYTGVGLNGDRAGVYGGVGGMLLRLGNSSVTDPTLAQAFSFSNGAREYFKLFTSGTQDTPDSYVNNAAFSAHAIPTIDLTYSLGTNSLRWLGIYGDSIYASTVNTDTLNATTISTDTLNAGDIITTNLTAGNIQTNTLTATTANITHLTAGDIVADIVNATTVNATNVNTENITADNGTITNLTSTNATITNLTAQHITADTIDATTTNTNILNSTTINNQGDINTNHLTSESITTNTLDAQTITSNSITTQVLNATDVNTTNLTTQNFTAENGTITNLTTTNLTTDNITVGGTNLNNYIQNTSYAPYGDRNQLQYVNKDGSKDYYTEDVVATGQFITNDAELNAAKGIFIGFSTIFSTWKRFSHGAANMETAPTSPYSLPSIPLETNSWIYNSSTDRINSTVNSDSFIGFVSPGKYSRYVHSVSVTAQDGITESFNDNDFEIIVMAYAENPSDLIVNSAYQADVANYQWQINTSSPTIANQHTLSLVRGRTSQQPYLIGQSVRYAIIYNLGKPDQEVLVNGETQVWNTENNFDTGKTCDIKIIRDGDIFKTYTTNWDDAPGGKGVLGHELTLDLSTRPMLAKFRGSAAYGYGALSQKDTSFYNVSFSPSVNTIYDVRNGDVWSANAAGTYSIDSSRSFYTEYGIRRLYYNPTTTNLIYVKPDKNFYIVNTSSTGDITGAITDVQEPTPNKLRFFKGTDYFDVNFTLTGGGGTGGTPSRFGMEDNTSDVDRSVDMADTALNIQGGNSIDLMTGDFDGAYSEIIIDKFGTASMYTQNAAGNKYSKANLSDSHLDISNTDDTTDRNGSLEIIGGVVQLSQTLGLGQRSHLVLPDFSVEGEQTEFFPVSISVNGGAKQFADAAGNIDLAVSGGGNVPTTSYAPYSSANASAFLDKNTVLIVDSTIGTLNNYAFKFPNPSEVSLATGDFVEFIFAVAVTNATYVYNSGTMLKVGTPPNNPVVGTWIKFVYNSSNSTWYCVHN